MASSSSSPLIQVDRCQDGGLLPPNVCCCYCSVTVGYMFPLIRNYYTLFIMSIFIFLICIKLFCCIYIFYILYIVIFVVLFLQIKANSSYVKTF